MRRSLEPASELVKRRIVRENIRNFEKKDWPSKSEEAAIR